jgi:hypothetical protein
VHRKKRGLKKSVGEKNNEGNTRSHCQWIMIFFPSFQEVYSRSEYCKKKGGESNQTEFESDVEIQIMCIDGLTIEGTRLDSKRIVSQSETKERPL